MYLVLVCSVHSLGSRVVVVVVISKGLQSPAVQALFLPNWVYPERRMQTLSLKLKALHRGLSWQQTSGQAEHRENTTLQSPSHRSTTFRFNLAICWSLEYTYFLFSSSLQDCKAVVVVVVVVV